MPDEQITDYRYRNARRKNNPPAGLAPEGRVKEAAKVTFDYNPHLPPALRFDASGKSDALPPLLQKARTQPLSEDDLAILADALRNREPWLEWAGKRESPSCEVDPVALHIHERVSAQAILRVAARQDVTRNLFADPEQAPSSPSGRVRVQRASFLFLLGTGRDGLAGAGSGGREARQRYSSGI